MPAKSDYRKQDEFIHFYKILDQLKPNSIRRLEFNRLLGEWWHVTLLEWQSVFMIRHNVNPVTYVFLIIDDEKVYAVDFESARLHANPIYGLRIMAAELKQYLHCIKLAKLTAKFVAVADFPHPPL